MRQVITFLLSNFTLTLFVIGLIASLIALLLVGPLLMRWFGLRRARRLIDTPDKSFVMTAALAAHRRGR